VKSIDPESLVTYVNYPSTEYLQLRFLDFACFSVYLETQPQLEAYLARLQNLVGNQPLVMAEVGLDSLRNGEQTQSNVLAWQASASFAAGCAGVFAFACTDEWHRGGCQIEGWDFGLTRRDARLLEWRVGGGDYTVLEVLRNRTLVGLVASQKKREFLWLVCDVVVADAEASLRATLIAAVNLAHRQALAVPANQPIRTIGILVAPFMRQTLLDLNFTRDQYDFPVVIHRLDPSIPLQECAPPQWYVSAND
jgi:hypothetical protein